MAALPHNWAEFMLMVFFLGARHGIDADHLATIDGLTRINAVVRPKLSRWSGFLFSLGHGLVVTAAAVLIGLFTKQWAIPHWMDDFGAWVSILFLLALGAVNLVAVLRTRPCDIVQPAGLKGRFFGRLSRASHPVLIVLVGALFALSFDTMSQTALFSLAATRMSGWYFSATLGLTFMVGMMVTDGMNGLWISRLLRRADRRARIASRVLGLSIAILSLSIAAFSIVAYWSPQAATWSDSRSLGIGVVLIILMSYWFALRLTDKPTEVGARS